MEKIPKKQEEESEEEVEEIEEEVEEEDDIGEDFAQDPRAFPLQSDAGKIADSALNFVITLIKPEADIYEICNKGDEFIRNELGKTYTKKKYFKGIAFPTSISVNEVCGNYSPIKDSLDEKHVKLAKGDVCKIDLGVQIHGFPAVIAHTVVCGEDKVTGKKADVILAAYNALHAGIRKMYVEKNNNDHVTETIQKVTESYKCNALEGVLSHRMRRDIIDGFETILLKKTVEHKVDIRDFDHGDVYGFDVIVSTGEGKPKESELKTTIYKRAVETNYKLKTDAARKLLSAVEQNFFNYPFSLNSFDNEENIKLKKPIENLKNVAKMGLNECVKHELFYPHPILEEKKDEIVAHFKYTVALRNEGPLVIAGGLLDTTKFESEFKVEDDEIKKLLEVNFDTFLPNSKKSVKVQKKKDNKAKKAKKKENKEKRLAGEE